MTMEPQEDRQLIQQFQEGREAALTELVQRHLPAVYRFLFRMVGDEALAQDLTQETFIKTWKYLSRFDASRNFKTWIFSIAKNTAIDYLRKKQPLTLSQLESEDVPLGEFFVDDQPLPPEVLEREDLALAIKYALAQLPPKARSVVVLHETEELTFQEIADLTEEPLNTVKSRYRRALVSLRGLLSPKNAPK
jgi:RNA polymerase sigma-70 factor, ECF subfamily